ncbi:MAG: ABC transporter permease, partial [Acidobacteriota bacterium]
MSRGLAGTFGDLVLAVRSLARVPSFTAVAVGLLALGVGATTAVFGIAWTVVWRPLPLPEPDRLVWTMLQGQEGTTPVSPRVYFQWQDASSTLDSLGAVHDGAATLGGDAARGIVPERVTLLRATAELFTALGAPPAAGRLFGAMDAQPGGEPVVTLTHGLWQRRFAADASIVDTTIELDGIAHRIVGVLDPALDSLLPSADLVTPLRLGAGQRENRAGYLALIGRLHDDASITQAADELDRLLGALDAEEQDTPRTGLVVPLAEAFYGDLEPQIGLLLAAVLGVAAIGCGNLAILLLARGTARTREIGLRRALGAGRVRIARLLIAEGVVLGILGALAGTVLAFAGVDALRRVALPFAGGQIPRLGDARVDLVALAVAAALGITTAVLASLAPIWRAARLDPRSALSGGRGTTGGRDRLR